MDLAYRPEPWRILGEIEADVALLREATEPPPDVPERIDVDSAPWSTAGADATRPSATQEHHGCHY